MRQLLKRRIWDRHAIKAEVHRRGASLLAIARKAGLEPSSTRVALVRRHTAGEQAIADFLGVNPAELWPERYRGRVVTHPKHTAGPHRPASLKAVSA